MSARTRREGWILLETIVALVLLSVAMVAVNRAMYEAALTRAQAQDYTQARFLLEEKMAELTMWPVVACPLAKAGGFGEAHPRFSWEWSVSEVRIAPPRLPGQTGRRLPPDMQLEERVLGRLEVTVRWTRAGRGYERTAKTLLPSDRILVKTDPGLFGNNDEN